VPQILRRHVVPPLPPKKMMVFNVDGGSKQAIFNILSTCATRRKPSSFDAGYLMFLRVLVTMDNIVDTGFRYSASLSVVHSVASVGSICVPRQDKRSSPAKPGTCSLHSPAPTPVAKNSSKGEQHLSPVEFTGIEVNVVGHSCLS
jgi:hypothetical protein